MKALLRGVAVSAMMMGGVPPSVFGLVDQDTSTTNTDTHSFAVDFGTANADRRITVAVTWEDNVTLDSASIGGVSVDHLWSAPTGLANVNAAIISAPVPTGTSGNVVLGFSGNSDKVAISVYRAAIPDCHPSGGLRLGASTTADLVLDTTLVFDTGYSIVNLSAFGSSGQRDIVLGWSGTGSFTLDTDQLISSMKQRASSKFNTVKEAGQLNGASDSGVKVGISMVAREYSSSANVVTLAGYARAANASAHSFLVGAGPAHADLLLVIPFTWRATSTLSVSSVTVNGNSASAITTTTGNNGGAAIYAIAMPGGGGGTVVITMSGTVTSLAAAAYRTLPDSATPIDSGNNAATSTSVAINDIEIEDGGFVVAAGLDVASDMLSLSFSGTDNPTKDFQRDQETSTHAFFHMPTTEDLATGDFTLSSGSNTGKRAAIASWGPPA